MFSPEQYLALRDGAGLVTRADRGLLAFTGTDRRALLQGLLTNDMAALLPGSGCYAALLTANGRMIADMRVVELGDRTLLEVAASQAAALRERFDQSIFSEDAQVEDVSMVERELGLYGPLAGRVLQDALLAGSPAGSDLAPLALYDNRRVETACGTVVVIRSDEAGVEGFDLVVEAGQVAAIAARLREAGAVAVSAETAEVTRIEGGRPRFGLDMDEDTIPLEAGIEGRAISLTKGCYVGQEIIIRVLHRGQGRVAKHLVGLTLEADALPAVRGDVLRSSERTIGVVTSATVSPSLGRPVALGYVHRDFASPGTVVTLTTQGLAQPARVTSLPFVEAAARVTAAS